MLSFSDLTAAPLDLELARSADTAAQVDHLFVFRDTGALSIRGSARSSTDLFSLSVAGGGGRTRMSSFYGIVVGMRLSVRPERLPGTEALEPLVSTSVRVRQSDDGVPSLVAALDGLARALSLAAPPQAFSDRTGPDAAGHGQRPAYQGGGLRPSGGFACGLDASQALPCLGAIWRWTRATTTNRICRRPAGPSPTDRQVRFAFRPQRALLAFRYRIGGSGTG